MKLRCAALFTLSMISATAFAATSPWLIRARAIDVDPFASSGTLNLIGGHVNSISSQVVPELDFSYFFTSNIAAELILATSRHEVAANNTALGHVNLGKVNVLPPTLTVQYHFMADKKFSPYIGAGINYTYFYNVNSGPVATSISYQNSVGPALQIGADYSLDSHWLLNVDIKKIYIEPHVNVNTALGRISTTVDINPLVFGVGVGYRV